LGKNLKRVGKKHQRGSARPIPNPSNLSVPPKSLDSEKNTVVLDAPLLSVDSEWRNDHHPGWRGVFEGYLMFPFSQKPMNPYKIVKTLRDALSLLDCQDPSYAFVSMKASPMVLPHLPQETRRALNLIPFTGFGDALSAPTPTPPSTIYTGIMSVFAHHPSSPDGFPKLIELLGLSNIFPSLSQFQTVNPSTFTQALFTNTNLPWLLIHAAFHQSEKKLGRVHSPSADRVLRDLISATAAGFTYGDSLIRERGELERKLQEREAERDEKLPASDKAKRALESAKNYVPVPSFLLSQTTAPFAPFPTQLCFPSWWTPEAVRLGMSILEGDDRVMFPTVALKPSVVERRQAIFSPILRWAEFIHSSLDPYSLSPISRAQSFKECVALLDCYQRSDFGSCEPIRVVQLHPDLVQDDYLQNPNLPIALSSLNGPEFFSRAMQLEHLPSSPSNPLTPSATLFSLLHQLAMRTNNGDGVSQSVLHCLPDPASLLPCVDSILGLAFGIETEFAVGELKFSRFHPLLISRTTESIPTADAKGYLNLPAKWDGVRLVFLQKVAECARQNGGVSLEDACSVTLSSTWLSQLGEGEGFTHNVKDYFSVRDHASLLGVHKALGPILAILSSPPPDLKLEGVPPWAIAMLKGFSRLWSSPLKQYAITVKEGLFPRPPLATNHLRESFSALTLRSCTCFTAFNDLLLNGPPPSESLTLSPSPNFLYHLSWERLRPQGLAFPEPKTYESLREGVTQGENSLTLAPLTSLSPMYIILRLSLSYLLALKKRDVQTADSVHSSFPLWGIPQEVVMVAVQGVCSLAHKLCDFTERLIPVKALMFDPRERRALISRQLLSSSEDLALHLSCRVSLSFHTPPIHLASPVSFPFASECPTENGDPPPREPANFSGLAERILKRAETLSLDEPRMSLFLLQLLHSRKDERLGKHRSSSMDHLVERSIPIIQDNFQSLWPLLRLCEANEFDFKSLSSQWLTQLGILEPERIITEELD